METENMLNEIFMFPMSYQYVVPNGTEKGTFTATKILSLTGQEKKHSPHLNSYLLTINY
jgi:hypothetical protein